MDPQEPIDTLTPPPPAHDNEPQVTVDDPTAGGYYCGRPRSKQQLVQAREQGDPNPWPWCRNRSGRGTDHVGDGPCRNHGGNTPGARKSARLRYAELQGATVTVFAQVMADTEAPYHARLRAAENLADRGGSPRRTEVNVEAARQTLVERLMRLQAGDEVTS